MKKTAFLKDTITVGLALCLFVAVGGAINGEIIACVILFSLACLGLLTLNIRKKHYKHSKYVKITPNSNINHAA